MKKIILAVMAVAAISFTSCGNKTQQAEAAAVDSTAIIQANVDQAVLIIFQDLKLHIVADGQLDSAFLKDSSGFAPIYCFAGFYIIKPGDSFYYLTFNHLRRRHQAHPD